MAKCSKCGYKFKDEKTTRCPNCIMTKHASKKSDGAQEALLAGAGAAGGAAIGTAGSFVKPVMVKTRTPEKAKQDFMKKLKPGDVLLEGSYKNEVPEKIFQSTINRNRSQYHVTMYTGKHKTTGKHMFSEILPRHLAPAGEYLPDYTPTGIWKNKASDRINKDLHKQMRSGSMLALRPKYKNTSEAKKVIENVNKEITKATYDKNLAGKIWAERRLHINQGKECKGRFCSNVISSQMPQRMFGKIHRTRVMPSDFKAGKHFKHVAELSMKDIHLPASNKALKKYTLPAAIIGGLATGLAAHMS